MLPAWVCMSIRLHISVSLVYNDVLELKIVDSPSSVCGMLTLQRGTIISRHWLHVNIILC